MKPSAFLEHPSGSVARKSEIETIARNIMIILKRTGDTFRPLSFDEYVVECEKDRRKVCSAEQIYFNSVIGFCKSEDTARLFSPVWAKAEQDE